MPTSQGHPLSDTEEAESNTRSHPQILPPLPSPPPPKSGPRNLTLPVSPVVDAAVRIWGRQREVGAQRCRRTVHMNICLD